MQDFVSAYLTKTSRGYIVTHIFYLFTTVLITNKTVALFGYHYTFPTTVSMADGLTFMLSGQAIVPVVMFLIFTITLHSAGSFIYRFRYEIKFRRGRFKDFKNDLPGFGEFKGWFEVSGNTFIRGRRYFDLKRTIERFDLRGYGHIRIAELKTTCALTSTICIPLYDMNLILRFALPILSILMFIILVADLNILYAIEENLPALKKMCDDVEDNEKKTKTIIK